MKSTLRTHAARNEINHPMRTTSRIIVILTDIPSSNQPERSSRDESRSFDISFERNASLADGIEMMYRGKRRNSSRTSKNLFLPTSSIECGSYGIDENEKETDDRQDQLSNSIVA